MIVAESSTHWHFDIFTCVHIFICKSKPIKWLVSVSPLIQSFLSYSTLVRTLSVIVKSFSLYILFLLIDFCFNMIQLVDLAVSQRKTVLLRDEDRGSRWRHHLRIMSLTRPCVRRLSQTQSSLDIPPGSLAYKNTPDLYILTVKSSVLILCK